MERLSASCPDTPSNCSEVLNTFYEVSGVGWLVVRLKQAYEASSRRQEGEKEGAETFPAYLTGGDIF